MQGNWQPNDGPPIPLNEMSNLMLCDLLVALRVSAELKRRTTYAFYRNMRDELEGYGLRCCVELKKLDWKSYVEPVFHDLEAEASLRALPWWEGLAKEDPIDLNARGKLERLVVGAVKDCINAHGPITKNNASSVGKRVIGVIKHFNKGVKHDNARKDGLLVTEGSEGDHQADEGTGDVPHRLRSPNAQAG